MGKLSQSTIDAIGAAVAAALAAQAPVPAAPASAKAASPAQEGFLTFIHERAASKVACDIHAPEACNRKFTPASSGRTSHVARILA